MKDASRRCNSQSVRIIAAEALGPYCDGRDLERAAPVLTELARTDKHDICVSMLVAKILADLTESK